MITLNCIYVTLSFYKNMFNVSIVRIKYARSTIGYSEDLGVKDFNLMKRCIMWLGEIVRGMTWDKHMVAAARDTGDQWRTEGEILGEDFRLDGPPMFELGGV